MIDSIAVQVRDLERQRRKEISEVHKKFSEKIKALHAECAHEYGDEFKYNGELPDTNVFGEWFYHERCKKCGHVSTYLKSTQTQ